MIFTATFLCISTSFLFAQTPDSLIVWEPVQRITFNSVQAGPPRIEASGSNVYLCWQEFGAKSFFARSTDNGASWQQPTLLTDSYPPLVSSNKFAISGEHIYFYTRYHYVDAETAKNRLWLQRSTDAGVNWEAGKPISDWGKEPYSITTEKNHVVINYEIRGETTVEQGFAHSSDYGETWSFFDERLPGYKRLEIALRGGAL